MLLFCSFFVFFFFFKQKTAYEMRISDWSSDVCSSDLTIAILFLLALFLAPLAGSVPAYATAPALLYVAGLMLREITQIDWSDITDATPAALAAMIMPLTYSIANGLAFGFISYVVLMAITGKSCQLHSATLLMAALF